MHVPEEIWDAIFNALLAVSDDELMDVIPTPSRGAAVAIVSKQFYRLATPYLYSLLTIASPDNSDRLFHTLTSRPSLATHVKAVAVNGGYVSFPGVAARLSPTGVHTVSMSLAAFDGAISRDQIPIPGSGVYLGSCIATMRPKVVIIGTQQTHGHLHVRPGFKLAQFVKFSAWLCALHELWSWSDAESVYFNFLARPKDLGHIMVPPKVPFKHLWMCINLETNEYRHIINFMNEPGLRHVHLHVVPPKYTPAATFLFEFFNAVKEDQDLRQRVHLESDMGSSRVPFARRLPDVRTKLSTPIALSAVRGHRWEI